MVNIPSPPPQKALSTEAMHTIVGALIFVFLRHGALGPTMGSFSSLD